MTTPRKKESGHITPRRPRPKPKPDALNRVVTGSDTRAPNVAIPMNITEAMRAQDVARRNAETQNAHLADAEKIQNYKLEEVMNGLKGIKLGTRARNFSISARSSSRLDYHFSSPEAQAMRKAVLLRREKKEKLRKQQMEKGVWTGAEDEDA